MARRITATALAESIDREEREEDVQVTESPVHQVNARQGNGTTARTSTHKTSASNATRSLTPVALENARANDLEGHADTPTDPSDTPISELASDLRFLFVNTTAPDGKKWTLGKVVAEAKKHQLHMSRSYVQLLLKGKVGETSLRKVQILGLVFGVGSMGLIHPIESKLGEPSKYAVNKVLKELGASAEIIKRAMQDTNIKRAVLLLDGIQSPETMEQVTQLIEQFGAMEKRMAKQLSSSALQQPQA